MALIKGVAENLVHPVSTGGGDPGVNLGIPTCVEGNSSVLGGNGPHLDLLLGCEALGKVAGVADTGHEVILDVDTLAGLLGRDDDDTAGSGGCSVDSGRGGVLQDDDAFDVVHRGDRATRDTVNYPEDTVPVTGALSTDEDAGAAGR